MSSYLKKAASRLPKETRRMEVFLLLTFGIVMVVVRGRWEDDADCCGSALLMASSSMESIRAISVRDTIDSRPQKLTFGLKIS